MTLLLPPVSEPRSVPRREAKQPSRGRTHQSSLGRLIGRIETVAQASEGESIPTYSCPFALFASIDADRATFCPQGIQEDDHVKVWLLLLLLLLLLPVVVVVEREMACLVPGQGKKGAEAYKA